MQTERLLELLLKKQEGLITLPEHTELARLLNELPSANDASALVEKILESPLNFAPTINADRIEKSTSRLQQKLREELIVAPKRQLPLWLRISSVAASVLLLIGLVAMYFYLQDEKSPSQQIVATQKGSKTNITLPDGSKVWINAQTKLTYDNSFGKETREVNLTGEAYFDIVHNKNRPFIVHTKAMDIKVLGTEFNVRAYQSEESTQATLIKGSIEVLLKKKNNQKLYLKPDEKITVQNSGDARVVANEVLKKEIPEISISKIIRNPVDSAALETQWLKPFISFDQQKLENIIPMLEQWYNVKFMVTSNHLLQRRFSAKIESESLTDILESFRLASGLKYKIENDIVTLY